MLTNVKCPPQFEPLFQKAQEQVQSYFSQKEECPEQGTIKIFGERYLLVRGASLSVDFFETIKALYKGSDEAEALEFGRNLLFDIAHAIGKMDAREFHKKLNLKDPIEKLSAGPIHFAFTGWAFVDIFPESRPTPDENYYLIYDHPYSFESFAWKNSGKKVDFPVCVMNSGYSSGWCEESFGVPLVAQEILCQGKGDDACRFIMAHPSRIEGYIADYLKDKPALRKQTKDYKIPGFFERKKTEDALSRSERLSKLLLGATRDAIVLFDREGIISELNHAYAEIYQKEREDMLGTCIWDLFPPELSASRRALVDQVFQTGEAVHAEDRQGDIWFDYFIYPITHEGGGVGRVAVFAHNVTEQKMIEEELKDKVTKLEKMNKSMMGREMRIIELKQKISELEQRLADK